MIQRICTTIWITYNNIRNISLFIEETSNYFTVLTFLAKNPNINMHKECRHSTHILINIFHLKVC